MAFVDDNMIIGNIQKVQVSDVYHNLQLTLEKLQKQISKFDTGYGMVVQQLALTVFIENYISNNKNPLFEYLYDSTQHHATSDISGLESNDGIAICEEDALEYVNFAPDALTTILDNIISNACSYGFAGRETMRNLIKITLESDGDNYVVTVSNNGNPMHNDISAEDVFTYGKTSGDGNKHYGIGGYEIRKLMREFRGEATLTAEASAEFPVMYKLIFKDTNTLLNL